MFSVIFNVIYDASLRKNGYAYVRGFNKKKWKRNKNIFTCFLHCLFSCPLFPLNLKLLGHANPNSPVF